MFSYTLNKSSFSNYKWIYSKKNQFSTLAQSNFNVFREKRQKIRDLYSKFRSVRETEKEANVSPNTVNKILNNKKTSTGKQLGRSKDLNNIKITPIKKFCITEIQQNKIVNIKMVKNNLDFDLYKRNIRR